MHQFRQEQVYTKIGNDLPMRRKHLAQCRIGIAERQQIAARKMIGIIGEWRNFDGDQRDEQGAKHQPQADPPGCRAVE
jgi:hypothetical protein